MHEDLSRRMGKLEDDRRDYSNTVYPYIVEKIMS